MARGEEDNLARVFAFPSVMKELICLISQESLAILPDAGGGE